MFLALTSTLSSVKARTAELTATSMVPTMTEAAMGLDFARLDIGSSECPRTLLQNTVEF